VPSIDDELHKYIGGIVRNDEGDLVEANGDMDHRHLLILLKPKFAVSDVVREIKASSSAWLNAKNRSLHKFGWQDGYAAFTVSQSQVPRVSKYIRDQKRHHQRMDYKSELLALLEKHHVEYDERYLWR
jgi:REP-associated tyrosine transposase